MRVAYLFSRFPVVSQTFCVTEMLGLERAGVEIEIGSIHPPQNTIRHAALLDLAAPIHYAPPSAILRAREEAAKRDGTWPTELVEDHVKRYGEAYKPAVRARNALYFAQLFSERRLGHIHVHFTNRATLTALFIKRIAGIPFSFTAHAQDFMVDLGSMALLAELCREAVFVVAVSDWSAKLLREMIPESAHKISRVYNGFDFLSHFQSCSRGAAPAGPPLILSVGRLIDFKGFDHLVRACALLKRRSVAYRCLIIGDGPNRDALQELIQSEGLERDVQILGAQPLEAVFKHMESAHVFALASDVDSRGACDVLPTVISEAMAHGLPVVSTSVSGIPEMVKDGETGWLARPGDPEAFARALHDALIVAPGEWQRLSENARRHARQLFDLSVTSGELRRLFAGAIKTRNLAAPPAAKSVILADSWPFGEGAPWQEIAASCTGAQMIARRFHPARRIPQDVRMPQFLPDAMVLEGTWIQQTELRAAMEAENELRPAGPDTYDYLEQARAACWLLSACQLDGVEKVHALGWRSLLLAWLLKRHLQFDLTATVEESLPWGVNALRELGWSAVAIWCPNRQLVEKVGAPLCWYDCRKPGRLAVDVAKSLSFP
jgi:glycosyltransferase involved in cell wall biosynthesis